MKRQRKEQLTLLGLRAPLPSRAGGPPPMQGSQAEQWQKDMGTTYEWGRIAWITIQPGAEVCRLAGGIDQKKDKPWTEPRDRTDARRVDLWRDGYELQYVMGF